MQGIYNAECKDDFSEDEIFADRKKKSICIKLYNSDKL